MQRSKSNEFNKEVDKTSELLGEALLNAIRLAVREEIREASAIECQFPSWDVAGSIPVARSNFSR